MSKKLFVGGLSWDTTDQSLRAAFEAYGPVREARVILDRDTGRSRGFGFVSYDDPRVASDAVVKMNGSMLDGRTIRVNEAEERRGGPGGERGGDDRGPRRGFGDRAGGPEVLTRGRGGYGDDRGGFRGGDDRGGFRGGDDRGGFRGGDDRGGFRGGDDRGGFRGGDDRGGFRGGSDRPGGFRSGGPGGGDRPGGPGGYRSGGPGGGGGFRGGGGYGGGGPSRGFAPPGGGFEPGQESGWEDARERRDFNKKRKKKTEAARGEEEFKTRTAGVKKGRRESGRTWRDYDIEDENAAGLPLDDDTGFGPDDASEE